MPTHLCTDRADQAADRLPDFCRADLFCGSYARPIRQSTRRASGRGQHVFWNALSSLRTTLPELVAGLTAVRMRAFALVVGNAFGTIAFNLLLLAPIDFAYDGSLMAAASAAHVITCFAAILVIAITVMGQLYNSERRIVFLEPDALLIIALVVAAFGLIYYLG